MESFKGTAEWLVSVAGVKFERLMQVVIQKCLMYSSSFALVWMASSTSILQVHIFMCDGIKYIYTTSTYLYKDKEKDTFIGMQKFVVYMTIQ